MRQHFSKPSQKTTPRPVAERLAAPAWFTRMQEAQRAAEEETRYRENERLRRELENRRKKLTTEDKLEVLAKRGATEGERNAAREALKRKRKKGRI